MGNRESGNQESGKRGSGKRLALVVGVGLALIVVLAVAAYLAGRSLRPYNLHAVELDPPGPQIEIEGAWARPSPKMAGTGVVYMILENKGGEADKLLSGETPAAEVVELHESFMDENQVMKMRAVEGGYIEAPAGGEVELKPGGRHIMLVRLVEPLEEGQTIQLTLTFERSGEIEIEVPVSQGPPGQ